MSGTDTTVADDPGYEPLAVEDRYPPAAATPDPDPAKGWFRRLKLAPGTSGRSVALLDTDMYFVLVHLCFWFVEWSVALK